MFCKKPRKTVRMHGQPLPKPSHTVDTLPVNAKFGKYTLQHVYWIGQFILESSCSGTEGGRVWVQVHDSSNLDHSGRTTSGKLRASDQAVGRQQATVITTSP